jgi:uncharacterized protein YbjT (DUF2867 family)
MFFLTPASEKSDVLARNAIAAAKKAGAPCIVRLSVIRAGPDAPTANTRMHGQTEKDVHDSGLPVAFLRPHCFMQNIFGSLQTIAAEGVFYQGMGDGKLVMIDVGDMADSAAGVLLDRSHAGTTYTLTGPASITWHTAAEAFSKALGRVGSGSDAGLQRRVRDTRQPRRPVRPQRFAGERFTVKLHFNFRQPLLAEGGSGSWRQRPRPRSGDQLGGLHRS